MRRGSQSDGRRARWRAVDEAAEGAGRAAGAGTAIERVTTRRAGAARAGAAAALVDGALAFSGRRKISVMYSTLPAQ
jgi:hypothetical protein